MKANLRCHHTGAKEQEGIVEKNKVELIIKLEKEHMNAFIARHPAT